MTPPARLAGGVLAAAVLAGLAWASAAPMPAHRSSDAVLRLAWSALPERIEKCREQSAEELARLPAHMRQPVACEGTTAEYRLQVRVDGALVRDRIVHGGGLRRDRRLYVFEEFPIQRREADIDIRFDRTGSSDDDDDDDDDDDSAKAGNGPRQHGDWIPAHSSLTGRLHFAPRRVILVTYDSRRRQLAAREAAQPGS